MLTGKIAALIADKGFGFIRPSGGGDDVYFHRSVLNGEFQRMRVGEEVTYELDAAAKKARAKYVRCSGRPRRGGSSDRPERRASSRSRDPRSFDRRSAGNRLRNDKGRSSRGDRPGSYRSDASSRRSTVNRRLVDRPEFEFGFVTKIHKRDKQGFISSDKNGPELVFDSVDVNGPKPFEMLRVGDYVSFLRDKTKPETPTAIRVRIAKRLVPQPRLHMPRHPKSRAKKPTWR